MWITASINISLAQDRRDGNRKASAAGAKKISINVRFNYYLRLKFIKSHMKKFLSTQYSEGAFNIATLALRLSFGLLLLIDHGLGKITHFSNLEYNFFDFVNIGHRWSLVLCIFAEVFCSSLLVLGLFTRLAALVLVINFTVASFLALKGQPLAGHESALAYLAVFFALLLTGPGRISVDGATGR